jgi:hypothetical protein
MFYGYPISQWLELLQYSLEVFVLFIGIGILSCIITNKLLHKKKKKFKPKKTEKKSYFVDVA